MRRLLHLGVAPTDTAPHLGDGRDVDHLAERGDVTVVTGLDELTPLVLPPTDGGVLAHLLTLTVVRVDAADQQHGVARVGGAEPSDLAVLLGNLDGSGVVSPAHGVSLRSPDCTKCSDFYYSTKALKSQYQGRERLELLPLFR